MWETLVTNDYESQSCFNAKKFNLTDRRVYLPEYIQKSVFVDVFGRKHSAPTGDVFLSLTAMGQTLPLLMDIKIYIYLQNQAENSVLSR